MSVPALPRKFSHIIHRLVFAYHGQAVAVLQAKVVGGERFDITSDHAAHVHAIRVAQLQFAQFLPLSTGRVITITRDSTFVSMWFQSTFVVPNPSSPSHRKAVPWQATHHR